MPIRLLTSLVLLLTVAVTLDAQCVFYPSDTPSTGTPDDRPFGDMTLANGTMRYQVQIPTAVLGNQPLLIQEMFVAPAGSHSRSAGVMQVVMGHNPNPLSTLMWANFPGSSEKTVAAFGEIEFTTTADQWLPIGMWQPYQYDPSKGMLVVQIFVRDAVALSGSGSTGFRTDPSIPYMWNGGGTQNNGIAMAGGGIKLRFCTEHHGFLEFTNGACAGSNGLKPQLSYSGTPRVGNTVNVHVTDAPAAPNTLAVLVWAFEPRPVPFRLNFVTAPGCSLNVEDDVLGWMFINGGSHTNSLTIPVGFPPHLRLWNQWFLLDPPVNQLGAISSTYGGFLIGN